METGDMPAVAWIFNVQIPNLERKPGVKLTIGWNVKLTFWCLAVIPHVIPTFSFTPYSLEIPRSCSMDATRLIPGLGRQFQRKEDGEEKLF